MYDVLPKKFFANHILNMIKQAACQFEDLLAMVKQGQLKSYGRITTSPGLGKTIKHGTLQGRHKKRWEDIIKWTGLSLADSVRLYDDRERWRKLLSSHQWCLNDFGIDNR